MIDYDGGYWGVSFIWRLEGSVTLKALAWAVPNAALAISLHYFIHGSFTEHLVALQTESDGLAMGIAGFNTVLGFLLVFRTQQAYSRWWEGSTLLQTTRGEWFNAYSNLLAFCSKDPGKQPEVDCFQHLLVRLMSLLYGSALEQVSNAVCEFDIINLDGIEEEHLKFLWKQPDKVEVVLQWIQQLIMDKDKEGVLQVAPPILSRVFQELSRGVVNVANARKISELPFPFPYAQILGQALLIHWCVTALLMSILCQDVWWAGILAFSATLFMWSINYVAQEIEDPFGCDNNDLPLHDMQKHFNHSLATLLVRRAKLPPEFKSAQNNPPIASATMRLSALMTSWASDGADPLPALVETPEFEEGKDEKQIAPRPQPLLIRGRSSVNSGPSVFGHSNSSPSSAVPSTPSPTTPSGKRRLSKGSVSSNNSARINDKKKRGFHRGNTTQFISYALEARRGSAAPEEELLTSPDPERSTIHSISPAAQGYRNVGDPVDSRPLALFLDRSEEVSEAAFSQQVSPFEESRLNDHGWNGQHNEDALVARHECEPPFFAQWTGADEDLRKHCMV